MLSSSNWILTYQYLLSVCFRGIERVKINCGIFFSKILFVRRSKFNIWPSRRTSSVWVDQNFRFLFEFLFKVSVEQKHGPMVCLRISYKCYRQYDFLVILLQGSSRIYKTCYLWLMVDPLVDLFYRNGCSMIEVGRKVTNFEHRAALIFFIKSILKRHKKQRRLLVFKCACLPLFCKQIKLRVVNTLSCSFSYVCVSVNIIACCQLYSTYARE